MRARTRRSTGGRTRVLLRGASTLVCVLAGLGVLAGPAHAQPIEAADPADTPYLDAVEDRVREVSPGTERTVWERTAGKILARPGEPHDDWLLQTPDCWGQAACDAPEGLDPDARGDRVEHRRCA